MPPAADYNPTPHRIPEGENATPLEVVGGDCTATEKLIIVMCGLPATGKTHISNRIARYISFFLDMETKIFNVSKYRSDLFGSDLKAEFFDHSNEEYVAKRLQACDAALSDLTDFMKKDGVRVGILDSTNSTRERRTHIREVVKSLRCKVIVMETTFDKDEVSCPSEFYGLLHRIVSVELATDSISICNLVLARRVPNTKVECRLTRGGQWEGEGRCH